MKSFFSLLSASYKEFVRDRMAMFFTFVFPVMFILIFGVIFAEQDDIGAYPVGVVLEDESDPSALGFFCMFEMIDRKGEKEPALNDEDAELCAPWIEQVMAEGFAGMDRPSEDEAGELPLYFYRGTREDELNKLSDADRRAVIVFPAGFGEQVEARMDGGSTMANLEIHYDASQTTSAQVIQSILSSLFDIYDRQLSGSEQLINVDFQSTTADHVSYMDFFVPGVLAMSLMQGGLFGSLTLVSMRERKILKRLGATPLPRRTLVLSGVILRLIIVVLQTILILFVGWLLFNVQIGDQYALMAAFILLGGLSFTAIGYLVASFARTEASGTAIVQVIQFPMMFLSGVFFPIDFAPDWLRPIVDAMPLTYLGDALRQVMVAGSSKLFSLPLNAAVLGGWLVVSLIIGFRFFRWE